MSDDIKPDDPGRWADSCMAYIGVCAAIVDDVFPSYFDQHRMHKGNIQDDAMTPVASWSIASCSSCTPRSVPLV
jgi:hypothetical protein